jgi:D-alanyl-lipoteichoic acid acyltransferase DltB (MBOAT superfamily)
VLFPTVAFAAFFAPVFALSWLLMPHPRAWKPFIVFASYVFYAAADPRFCALLAAVTLGNQAAAKLIHRTSDERRRTGIAGAAVALDLILLATFKYYGFFVTSLNTLLARFSLDAPLPLLSIALPVGISFFTFQAISYTVDVKRRIIAPYSTLDVAIYLSFFPHLIAGPIVRGREFLPQLATPRSRQDLALGSAVWLIGTGLVMKVVIADYLARHVADPVFAVPAAYGAPDAWLAMYAYAAQIFCDFAGYTNMAIGLALLLGFKFPQNFDKPYRATSFQEFWRRWHMTLSRFLRDFIYIPLGGSRRGEPRTSVNLMVTMLLGGLWHGAAWTFVIWGGFHGAAQVVERRLRGRFWTPAWLRWLIVFNLICLAWVLFRATDIGTAWEFYTRLVTPGPATLFSGIAVAFVVLVIGLQLVPERLPELLRIRFEDLAPSALGATLLVTVLVVAATVPTGGVPPFIYFRF